VPTHPVIDPVINHSPLDATAFAVFAAAFVVIAFATARRPSYGAAALIALVPFGFPHDVGHTTITLDKIALLAAAAGLALGRHDPRALRAPAVRLIAACACAVVVATALSVAGALYREPAIRETLKAAQYLLLFLVVAIAVAADSDDRPIRLAIVGLTIVVGALAIAQEIFGAPSGLWFDNVPIPRIAGPLEGPNQLAGYLGLLLALVTAYAIRRGRTAFEFAALAIGSAALVLTISRAGVAAALIGAAVVLAVSKHGARRGAIVAIASGSLAGCIVIALWGYAAAHSLLGLQLLDRFTSLAANASPGRLGTREQLWHGAIVLWRRHPIFGIGGGNFERELGLAGYPALHTHANSLYLQALAEGGIVLLLATVALVAASIGVFTRGPFSVPLVAGALGASIGLAVHQIFDLLTFFPKVGEMWWIVLALSAVRVAAAPVREVNDLGLRVRLRPKSG
jgi:O-antigen ligase